MSPSEQAGVPEVPVTELSYTEASRELDAIVEYFEQRDVDVDQLVARLERATSIVDELDRRIRRTRAQVEQLVPRLEAVGRKGSEPEESAYEEDDEDTEDVWESEAVSEDDLEEELDAWGDDDEDVYEDDESSARAGSSRPDAAGSSASPDEQPLF